MSAPRFSNPIFVALDTPDLGEAVAMAKAVGPYVGGLKIGLEFISAQGPKGIESIVALGRPVFADVKFHDIPNTVAGAARALARLGAALFNVHASGGEAMMRAAVEAAHTVDPKVRVLGVTVLTSLDQQVLDQVGQMGPPAAQVERLAKLAKASGLHGVVCSAHEIQLVRKAAGRDFLIATPGIRPLGSDLADQKRVLTPAEAMAAGTDVLILGRAVTASADPAAAARAIAAELQLVPTT
ncbi:MAG TPA: orotidine-5'-phosphate decarboxylase [Rhizomicrobium sp.]|nr:orotidine-5'-phosphate decarboxylase [Rhizomicrobium sp.]